MLRLLSCLSFLGTFGMPPPRLSKPISETCLFRCKPEGWRYLPYVYTNISSKMFVVLLPLTRFNGFCISSIFSTSSLNEFLDSTRLSFCVYDICLDGFLVSSAASWVVKSSRSARLTQLYLRSDYLRSDSLLSSANTSKMPKFFSYLDDCLLIPACLRFCWSMR